MSTLTKFKQLKKAQVEAVMQQEEDNRRQDKEHTKERKKIYNKFVEMIKSFNNETVNKHKITLEFHDRNNSVEMFIDGKLYTTFIVETEYHFCNCSACCDGGSEHEGTYTHDLNTFVIKKGEREDGPYFSWNEHCDGEDEFVREFDHFIERYNNKLFWTGLGDDK